MPNFSSKMNSLVKGHGGVGTSKLDNSPTEAQAKFIIENINNNENEDENENGDEGE
jgi:hypothetical protein